MIKIINLSKSFYVKNEQKDVILGVNLEVKQGELFALLGKNGAGKSTLLKILSSLIAPTAGYAELCGYSILHSARQTRQITALVCDAEKSFYQMLSVKENLRFYARLFNVRDNDFTKKCDELSGIFGIRQWLSAPVSHCSSGIKQKAAVLRALLPDPRVLLIDEPTRSLDEESKQVMRDCIRKYISQGERACIMVTHDAQEAQTTAHRLGFLEHGIIQERNA